MRGPFLTLQSMRVLALVAWPGLLAASCLAQAPQPSATAPSSSTHESLKTFLQDYLRKPSFGDDKSTRFFAAFVDLHGNGIRDAVVYITGDGWCGSGGCNTLILKPQGNIWKVVTTITITRPPIRVLDAKSYGWRNIGVWVQGGGIQPGYEAELRYDGKTYPRNPSVPPARRLAGKVPEKAVVPSSQEGEPLYP